MQNDHLAQGSRAGRERPLSSAERNIAAAGSPSQPPVVEFGSGWYHDAAIKAAEQPRDRRH